MDDIPEGILFASLALLICLSAFFSASETATMAVNRYRLADKANKKDRRALLLQKLVREPDRLLGTILLGNNLVNNAAVAITTMLAWKYYGEAGVAVSTAFITVVILVLAEIPPKTVAAIYPERIAFFAVYLLDFLQKLFHPVVWLLSSAVKLLKLLPAFRQIQVSDSLDTDELRVAVKASEHHFAPDQMELLLGILELGAQSVDKIMVPRNEIHSIDLDDDISDIVEQIFTETFARVIVYEKSYQDIKGELEIRALLQSCHREEITKDKIVAFLKEPIYLPEDSRLLEQIQRLQRLRRNMGIVVDEYGEVVGLITVHEMLEELAGFIDPDMETFKAGIIKEKQGTYLVNAMMNVRELNRAMQWDLPTNGPNTLNGQILEQNEDIPQPGTTFLINGYAIETVRVRGGAIDVVRILPNADMPDSVTDLQSESGRSLQ